METDHSRVFLLFSPLSVVRWGWLVWITGDLGLGIGVFRLACFFLSSLYDYHFWEHRMSVRLFDQDDEMKQRDTGGYLFCSGILRGLFNVNNSCLEDGENGGSAFCLVWLGWV